MRKSDESDCFVIDGSVGLNVDNSILPGSDSSALMDANHLLEVEVSRRLKSHPEIEFNDLVVRRCHDGLCVEGMVFTRTDISTVKDILKDLAPLGIIHNRLTINHKDATEKLESETTVTELTAVITPGSAKQPSHAGINALNRFFGKK